MEVSQNIRYVGVNDHQIDLFEGQFPVPNGMAYNSYLILDEKPAVMDSVDVHFTEEWFANLERELDGRMPGGAAHGTGSFWQHQEICGKIS